MSSEPHNYVGQNYLPIQQLVLEPNNSIVGVPGSGMIRFNPSTNTVQLSNNGSSFADIGTGSASSLSGGTNITITTVGAADTISTVNGPTFSGTTTLAGGNLVINQAYDGTTATMRAPSTNSIVIGNASSNTIIQGNTVWTDQVKPVGGSSVLLSKPVVNTSGSAALGGLQTAYVSGANQLQFHNGSVWSNISSIVVFGVNSDPNNVAATFSPNKPADVSCIYVSSISSVFWYYNGSAYVTATSFAFSVGSPLGSSTANGATFSGGVLQLGPADGTNPGLITTGAQTIAGTKTFTSTPAISSLTSGNVVISGASGTLTGSSKLTMDQTNGILSVSGSASSASISASNTTAGADCDVLSLMAPNVTVGGSVDEYQGKNMTANNYINKSFVYAGSGSTSNRYDISAGGSSVPIMSVVATGNVGIGTTAPGYALDIIGSELLRPAVGGNYIFSNPATPEIGLGLSGAGQTFKMSCALGLDVIDSTSSDLAVANNANSSSIYVSGTNGYVTIGSNASAYPLDVRSSMPVAESIIGTYNGTYNALRANNASTGTSAVTAIKSLGSDGTSFLSMNVNGSGTTAQSATNIGGSLDTALMSSSATGDMYLAQMSTTKAIKFATGSASAPYYNVPMTLTNAGNLGIGTTSPLSPLHINQSQALSTAAVGLTMSVTDTSSPFGVRTMNTRINTTVTPNRIECYGYDITSINTKSLGYAWQQSNNSQASYIDLLKLDYAGNSFGDSSTSIPLTVYGKLGLHTTSTPLNTLHVNTSSALTQVAPQVDGITIQNNPLTSSNAGLNIVSGTAGQAGIYFGDASGYPGSAVYSTTTDQFEIGTGNSFRLSSPSCAFDIIPFSDNVVYMRTTASGTGLKIQGNAGGMDCLYVTSTNCLASNLVIGTAGAAVTGGVRTNAGLLQFYSGGQWNTVSSHAPTINTATYQIYNNSGVYGVNTVNANGCSVTYSAGYVVLTTSADCDDSCVMTVNNYGMTGGSAYDPFYWLAQRQSAGVFHILCYDKTGAFITIGSLLGTNQSIQVQTHVCIP